MPTQGRSTNPSGVPVAVLYSFDGSCYASAARLALIEKGYAVPDECNIVNVDLLNGANFSPEFLKINPKGTVPSLVVPQFESAIDENKPNKYTAITDTVKILEFLDRQRTSGTNLTSPITSPIEEKSETAASSVTTTTTTTPSSTTTTGNTNPARSLAPGSLAAKARDDDIIALTQSSKGDPNLLLLVARTEDELKAKNQAVPGQFIRGRKKALENYIKELEDGNIQGHDKENLKSFYDQKLKAMNSMLENYEKPSQASEFLTKGQEHWLSVSTVILQLNSILPREDRSGFITLADLHAGAWFARILACAGAKDLNDVEGSFGKLEKAFGTSQEDLIALKNWWSSMVSRESFKEVYASGLH